MKVLSQIENDSEDDEAKKRRGDLKKNPAFLVFVITTTESIYRRNKMCSHIIKILDGLKKLLF